MNYIIANKFLGAALIISSLLSVIPIAVKIIITGPMNGFNYGFLLLPFVVPLSLFSMFGVFAFLDLDKIFFLVKRIATGLYLTVCLLFLSVGIFFSPLLVVSFVLFIPLIATANLEKSGVNLYFLLHNGILSIINLGILFWL